MEPIITLDGFQLNPPLVDGTGFDTYADDGLGLTGWYGSPGLRTAYTARPFAAGSYYADAFMDVRALGITGTVIQSDRRGLLLAQRQLSAICRDPDRLYELRVVDELGTLVALVQRSSDVLFKPVNDQASSYSIALTAPDPRLLDVAEQSASTLMAQSGGTGIQWRGVPGAAATNLVSNSGFETNTTGWSAIRGTIARSTAQHHSGSASALLTPDGSGTAQVTTTAMTVTPGSTYQASVWFYATAAMGSAVPEVDLWFYDASGTIIANPYQRGMFTIGGWSNVTLVAQAPLGAVSAAVVPVDSFGTTTTPAFYIDDVVLQLATTNMTGTAWRGTDGTSGTPWRGPAPEPGGRGIMVLNNTEGTAEADIVFTIHGPVSQPSVSTSTDTITYNADLGVGDVLTIDTGTGLVLLNGVNRRPYLSSADFFQIPPESTLDVLYSAAVQNSVSVCSAVWHTSY